MTFAQALARIEELIETRNTSPAGYHHWCMTVDEIKVHLYEHASDIVQLAKVAAEMRSGISVPEYSGMQAEIKHPSSVGDACFSYDKLMKGK